MWFNVPPRPLSEDRYFDRYASGRSKYSTCPEGGAMFQVPDSDPPRNQHNNGYVPPPAEEMDWGDG
jgi:hypothetical protein